MDRTPFFRAPYFVSFGVLIHILFSFFKNGNCSQNALLSSKFAPSTTSTTVVVNLVTDLPLSETKCNTTTTPLAADAHHQCSLRGAWEFCTLAAYNFSECRISLPAGATLYQNKSLGPLFFSSVGNRQIGTIVFDGNGATLQGIEGESQSSEVWKATEVYRPFIDSTDDPIVVSVCPGMTAIISTCDPKSYGDTIMRLYTNLSQPPLKTNDDACGQRSRLDIATSESETSCMDYYVVVTCWDSTPCGAKIFVDMLPTSFLNDEKTVASINSSSSQFLSYVSTATATRLVFDNLTISSFGDIYSNGGAISIWQELNSNSSGNFLLQMKSITFQHNVGVNGGAFALMMETTEFHREESVYDSLDISLANVHFNNNSAIFRGGAMYIKDYSKTSVNLYPAVGIVMAFNNVHVNSASSDIGGAMALYSVRSADLTGLTINNTSAITSGGGISIEYSRNISISMMKFSHIDIFGYGGGMSIEHSQLVTINNVLLSDLSSTTGSGIYIDDCNYLFIANSKFEYLIAVWYGAVQIHQSYNVSIEDSTFYSVTSFYYGGAVALLDSSDLSLNTLDIQYASALNYGGGGFYFNNSNYISVHSLIMSDVHAGYGKSGYGAGFLILLCNHIYFVNHYISSGIVVNAGSAYQIDHSNSLLLRNIVVTNSITQSLEGGQGGGAIVFMYSTYVKLRNIIVANTTAGHGSGLVIYGSNYTDVGDVMIKDCTAYDYAGGINIGSSQDMILQNVTVINSSASRCAGMLIVFSSMLSFSNIGIEGTMTTSSRGVGGGICLLYTKKTRWTDVRVVGSQSQSHGGGIYVKSCSETDLIRVDVTDCTTVHGDGGGYYFEQHNEYINFVDTITNSNTALSGSGGGFYISSLNSHLHWVGSLSYRNNRTFAADKSSKHQSFTFTGASNVIFYFSDDSVLNPDIDSCCTGLWLFDGDTGNVLFNYYNEYLPGVDQTPTILSNVTRLSVYYVNENNRNNNKVMITFIPVYPFDTDNRVGSLIGNNIAANDGGGIVMSYLNPTFLILHHEITMNQAQLGSGGGIFLRSANSRSLILNSRLFGNKAFVHGGGIYLGMSHSSMAFYGVEVAGNIALTGKGGGQYMFSTNGYGGLDYGNQLNYSRCLFANNTAALSGGGLYLQEQNALYLTESKFQGNQLLSTVVTSETTSAGHGGGIGVGEQNNLVMSNVELTNNEALNGCGGGLAVTSKNNAISLSNIIFSYGKALTGGGMCLLAFSTLSIQHKILLHHNVATDAGGAMVLVKSPLWNCNDPTKSCDIIVSSNKAVRAAVLFVVAVPSTLSTAVGNVTITQNVATDGCLVEWIYDAILMSRPPTALLPQSRISGATSNRLTFIGNSASALMGTQPMRIHATQAVDIEHYNVAIKPYIIVRTSDYYNRTVGDESLVLEVGEHDCLEVKNPYVSGKSVTTGKLTRGHARLTNLEAHCYPHGSMNVRITVPVDPLPSSLSSSVDSSGSCSASVDVSRYALTTSTILKFRGCRAGEYIESGNCVTCPNSTYSLIPIYLESTVTDSSLCQSCISLTGVVECYGNTLVLEQGYWRRYEESDAIISCILGDISCRGGSGVGDHLCHEGYTGPVCAACADGYHMSNQECHPCGFHGFSYLQIISLVIFGALIIAVVIIAHHSYKLYKKKAKTSQDDGSSKENNRSSTSSQEADEDESTDTENQTSTKPTQPPSEAPKFQKLNRKVKNRQKTVKHKQGAFSSSIRWLKNAFQDIIVKVKIIVATFQVVTSTAEVFDVTMPENYAQFSKFFSVLNLNLSAVFPVGCMFPQVNFTRRLLWATVCPFIIVGLLLLAMLIEFIYLQIKIVYKTDVHPKNTNDVIEKMVYRYINIVFYLTYLVLPSVTTMIFQLFICKNIDPDREDHDRYDSYLAADVNISCGSDYYKKWFWYGIAMVVVYPIGIPLFYFVCLYRYRDQIQFRGVEKTIEKPTNDGSSPVSKEIGKVSSEEWSDRIEAVERTRGDVAEERKSESQSDVSQIHRRPARDCESFQESLNRNNSVPEVITSPSCRQCDENNSPSRGISRNATQRIASFLAPSVSRPMLRRRVTEKFDGLHYHVRGMAFLWEAYKPEYWYWELIETFRRMLLTSVLSICGPGTIQQTVFGIILAYTFNKVYSYYKPYRVISDYRLSEIGQTQIFLTYFITLLLTGNIVDEKWHMQLGIALVLINVIVIGMGLCYEFAEWFEEPQHSDEEGHDKDSHLRHHREHHGHDNSEQRVPSFSASDQQDRVPSMNVDSSLLEQRLPGSDHIEQPEYVVDRTPPFLGENDTSEV